MADAPTPPNDIAPAKQSFGDKMRTNLVLTVVATFLIGFFLGVGVGASDTASEGPAQTAGGAEEETEQEPEPEPEPEEPEPEPEPEFDKPTKSDFKLRVRRLDEECFGSAGCNTEVRIGLTNASGIELDPTKTYELRYRILGANDPVLSTIEITGDNYTVNEHYLDTQQGAKLEAIVLSVSEF